MWVVFGLMYPHDPEPLLLFETEKEAEIYVNKLEGFNQYDSVYYLFVDISVPTKNRESV
jgi:hypothetical protein